METTTLTVDGMTCGGCVNSVKKALEAVSGVSAADVSLENGKAAISFDPAKTSIAQIKTAIEDAGFDITN